MTRDEARAKLKDAGLTYAVLTRQTLQRLRNLINQRMIDSNLINGTYRCLQRGVVRDTGTGWRYAGIRCRSYYFDSREAVSFNADGFIGFAGWADDNNVQPILEGFCAWVDELLKEKK